MENISTQFHILSSDQLVPAHTGIDGLPTYIQPATWR